MIKCGIESNLFCYDILMANRLSSARMKVITVYLMHCFFADLTAGGCSSDKPVWQMDRNIIINRLNSAYEQKVSRRSYPYYDSTTCLENRKAALMGFKEFTSGYTPNTTSEFHTLLQYEDDNLAIVLKWALEKVAIKPSKAAHPSRPFFQENIMTKEMKWYVCRLNFLHIHQLMCSIKLLKCLKDHD